jgi:uncharacterized protein YceK
MKKILALLGIVIALTGCQSVKEKTSAVGDFFDALGRGDIEFFKKQKKLTKNDDKSWEEVE